MVLNVMRAAAQVDDLVMVMDEALRSEACGVAQRLRRAGRTVDLVLEAKKMKWVFKVRPWSTVTGSLMSIVA